VLSGAVTYQWQSTSGVSTEHCDQSGCHWGTWTHITAAKTREKRALSICLEVAYRNFTRIGLKIGIVSGVGDRGLNAQASTGIGSKWLDFDPMSGDTTEVPCCAFEGTPVAESHPSSLDAMWFRLVHPTFAFNFGRRSRWKNNFWECWRQAPRH